MHGEEGVGLDWRSKDREREREGGKALGRRIKAAASSHEQNRGRRETGGGWDPSRLKGFFP